MSTRGAIGRITSKEGEPITFSCRYHHWDSNPESLGQTLFKLFKGHFKRDINAMLKMLIDDHPAGWSTINDADFALPAGYKNIGKDDSKPPQCYCHGDRKEKGHVITEKNASECGCEYIYAFTPDGKTMMILSSYCDDGAKMIGFFGQGDPDAKWYVIGELNLNGKAPKNWEARPLANAPSKSKKVVEKV